jgi:hypothetical protein
LELELDSALLNEPPRLHAQIKQLFGLVKVSLAEELNGGSHRPAQGSSPNPRPTQQGAGTRMATPAQIKALYALSRQQHLDLSQWLNERCQVDRPQDLTLKQASTLIDALKAMNGEAAA